MKRITFKRNFSDISQCIKCKSENIYIISSTRSEGTIRRRRRCLNCNHRFNTVEISVEELQKLTAKEAILEKFLAEAKKIQGGNHG